jgi:hypothetical protein
MEDGSTNQELPFTCDMNAIAPAERKPHIETIEEIFGGVQEIREISTGYSFRLANESTLLMRTAAFIIKERLCCPFFGFTLEVEPAGGAVWLSLTGPEGVKPFIQAELGHAVNAASWP